MKYTIGQKVWFVCKDKYKEKIQCPICNGEGQYVHNGQNIKCPKVKKITRCKYEIFEMSVGSILIQNDRIYYSEEPLDIEQDWDAYIPDYKEENELFGNKDDARDYVLDKGRE